MSQAEKMVPVAVPTIRPMAKLDVLITSCSNNFMYDYLRVSKIYVYILSKLY